MSLKDKYNQYKEDKERKDYFRKRNDLYVDDITMIKTVIGGLLISSLIAFGISYLENKFLIGLSFLYLLLGSIVAVSVKEISGVSSKTMGITSAFLVIVGICLGTAFYMFYISGFSLSLVLCLKLAITNVFNLTNIFRLLLILFGAYTAYINAR